MIAQAIDQKTRAPDADKGRQSALLALLLIYIVGAHLRLSLYSGSSILVPMYLMLLSSWTLVLWYAPALWARAGLIFSAIATFLVVQPLLGGGDNGAFGTIRSVLQLIASIGGALGILYTLRQIEKERLRRVLLGLWIVLILLALAESLFFKSIFDEIRLLIYSGSGRFIYLAEDRDLQIYGQIRTTVLASEPSFLSDTLSALMAMIFMLGKKPNELGAWLLLGVMVIISFSVSPSFKVAFFLIAIFIWQFWPRTASEAFRLLVVLLATALVLFTAIEVLLAFVNDVTGTHSTTGSFFGRIGSAHLVAMDALSQYPIMGFGLGNREDVYRIIVEVWHRTGAFSLFPWYAGLSAEHLLSNGFWWMWIYLGIAGGCLFLGLTASALRRVGVLTPWRSLVCASVVWYAGSAFIDPQSWYSVVVFSVGALAPKNDERR